MEFEYAAPDTLTEALQLRAGFGERAVLLAGGTDILVQLREQHRDAELVIDVKRIDELKQLAPAADDTGMKIGACVPCSQIARLPELENTYGAIFDIAGLIGGWQIQNRASIGGNLCNASPAADSIPPLIVHSAVCRVRSTDAERKVDVTDFCVAPGRNCLADDEVLVDLQLAPPGAHSGSAYLRFIPRNEMDIAVAGAAAWVRLSEDGQRFEDARIALSAVHATPVLASSAAEALIGQPVGDEAIQRAAELSREGIEPITDMRGTREYRIHLAGVLTARAIKKAIERARTN